MRLNIIHTWILIILYLDRNTAIQTMQEVAKSDQDNKEIHRHGGHFKLKTPFLF